MGWTFQIEQKSMTPVYRQLVQNVIDGIEQGKIQLGMKMPSINKIGEEFGLAPGTVIRAYEELREMGLMSSKQGKGYYISNVHIQQKIKVFLLFDRMNAYKEILHDSILYNLNPGIEMDVFFHHYDLKRFEKLIRENLGKYSYYAVMPHFNEDVSKILSKIPERKLIVLDKSVSGLKGKYAAVYQDFEKDIFNGLMANRDRIIRYKRFVSSSSDSSFQFVPEGCELGFKRFCEQVRMPFSAVRKLDLNQIQEGMAFLIYSDLELFRLLKEIDRRGWAPGKEVGIISYDETPMKEILHGGISVLTTDFVRMGEKVASFINGATFTQEANDFRMILRKSL